MKRAIAPVNVMLLTLFFLLLLLLLDDPLELLPELEVSAVSLPEDPFPEEVSPDDPLVLAGFSEVVLVEDALVDAKSDARRKSFLEFIGGYFIFSFIILKFWFYASKFPIWEGLGL